MSSKWRRFEVLLPLQFNDSREIPGELLAEALLEVVDNFGAASYETQKVEGHWRQGGVLYRDSLVRIVVDVPDSAKNPQWMKKFKSRCNTSSNRYPLLPHDLHRILPLSGISSQPTDSSLLPIPVAALFFYLKNLPRALSSFPPGPRAPSVIGLDRFGM